jgi:predicted metal-dependent hydrolase
MTPDSKQRFKDRVLYFAKELDVKVHALAVRPMKNKWASCSTNGYLNFDVELLALDQELSDYVIVHELLHFYVPNHGKLWKSMMSAHLGDYQKLEARLKKVVTG